MGTSQITILGAGAVGLAVGARLARAGRRVRFVVRQPSVARAIGSEGVRVTDPATGESWQVAAEATVGLAAAARSIGAGPVLVCVRASDTEAVARELAAGAPDATVVSVQNHWDNEAKLARHFARVLGVAFRQTCTRSGENTASFTGPGRVVLGLHPEGVSEEVTTLAEDFRAAGYDVGVSRRIGEDKWLKTCVNLMSAPNALVHRADHATIAFVETKARLLEEARAILAAAGIVARSCDGRDRSLDEEVAHQRGALARGTSARDLPLYNQVWAALRHGGPLEADRYHQSFLDLAAAHAVPAPVNARVLAVLERVHRTGAGPESVRAEELHSA